MIQLFGRVLHTEKYLTLTFSSKRHSWNWVVSIRRITKYQSLSCWEMEDLPTLVLFCQASSDPDIRLPRWIPYLAILWIPYPAILSIPYPIILFPLWILYLAILWIPPDRYHTGPFCIPTVFCAFELSVCRWPILKPGNRIWKHPFARPIIFCQYTFDSRFGSLGLISAQLSSLSSRLLETFIHLRYLGYLGLAFLNIGATDIPHPFWIPIVCWTVVTNKTLLAPYQVWKHEGKPKQLLICLHIFIGRLCLEVLSVIAWLFLKVF